MGVKRDNRKREKEERRERRRERDCCEVNPLPPSLSSSIIMSSKWD